MRIKISERLLYILFMMAICSCNEPGTGKAQSEFYTAEDYFLVHKVDAHVHINTADTLLLSLARQNNFRIISLNVAAPGYPSLPEQQAFTVKHLHDFPGRLSYATSFSMEGFDAPGWQKQVLGYLDSSFKMGAVGVKVWKNIGMELKDEAGQFIMIDHPRFDTIFDFIEINNKTLVGHIGEPKNCWLPVEQMTVKNDKDYFRENPRYHMHLHPEYPSYEDQLSARDNVLRKHVGLEFVGAHLGSLEWSVDALGARLDSFPNLVVDMAARISHLQYQARTDRKKVIDFFEKYQDRLVYATDMVHDDKANREAFTAKCNSTWTNHWKFFTSDEMMEAREVEGGFQGLHLPRTIIDKIYRINAGKWFNGLFDTR
jgi:hypothetical protein